MLAALITNTDPHLTSSALPTSARSQGSTSSTVPKDRLKAFTAEFDDAVRVQQACAVPDVELRDQLRKGVRDMITPAYIYFYNQNQTLFTSSSTLMGGRTGASKYHDPDHIDDAINHLFEG
jgi:hypothetical protein